MYKPLTLSLALGNEADVRLALNRERTFIAELHRNGASGLEICAALVRSMDEAVRSAFQSADSPDKDSVAILAVGGYGRAELSPGSDIDLLILTEPSATKEPSPTATAVLHRLWDSGLDIGHSVRTAAEAMALRGESIDAWVSMLESRLICGNTDLAERFFARLQQATTSGKDSWLIESIFAESSKRHARYGNSVKLLEPNIKNSAGGLRDLQTVFWLFRGTNPDYIIRNDAGTSTCAAFLERLSQHGILDTQEFSAAREAFSFLLRTRHEMHYQSSGIHDTLDYGLQLSVAEGLGYGPRAEMRSVEVFMRDYYLHAREIFRVNRRLSHSFREIIEPVRRSRFRTQRLGGHFSALDGILSVDPSVHSFTRTADVFEAFTLAAEHELELDFRLRRAIENSAGLLQQHADDEVLAPYFHRILRSRSVAPTLHAMNELNVLGRYIPEFGELVAFFQHNVYHYFTADEHTLIAIANAENLRDQEGILHEVFRNLRRKDILYMAILLHDIAKPRGVADHEVTGVGMAAEILKRLQMEDMADLVGFLIRHHLVMEQTAFRRNIYDPATLSEFSSRFERQEQLDLLYLLTYADLSAVNINVWTDWKAALLQELYKHTSEVLRRNLKGSEVEAFHISRRAAAVEDIVGNLSGALPAESVQRHLEGFQSTAYVSLFQEREIARHIQEIARLSDLAVLFDHAEGYTDVTIIAHDAPFILSKFCGVLAANDASIIDATVFTRDDSIIIDRFRVSDTPSTTHLETRTCDKITQDLHAVIGGALDIQQLFDAHRRKWRRRKMGPANPSTRVAVEFEDTPNYTIIDVYAPDSVGFLYRVTETISRLGLDIHFAKIATRVDGIVDAFYVRDRNDASPMTRDAISSALLTAVKEHLDEELA